LIKEFPNLELEYFQSNVEGELINKLQEVGFTYDQILLNAGGYTHTSVAISDCVKAIETPVIEIHISNIYAREEFRKKSLLSPNCKAVICGLGLDSYKAVLSTLKN
jgi:3-dehydroquinate dehydratase-2